jgi:hypothetical protein
VFSWVTSLEELENLMVLSRGLNDVKRPISLFDSKITLSLKLEIVHKREKGMFE